VLENTPKPENQVGDESEGRIGRIAVEVRYPCVRVRQDAEAKDLLLFSAPAEEIDSWIGIPQRLILEGEETAGFQRTVSPAREAALRKFFADNRNVIQNPLLAAIRQAAGLQVTFEPSADGSDLGHVSIQYEDLSSTPMLQLLRRARAYLESRAPTLKSRQVPQELITDLQQRLDLAEDSRETEESQMLSDNDREEADSEETVTDPAEEALFDESQITSFWDQLRAREEIASKFPIGAVEHQLLGFDRQVLESYLRPIILVDGQHRLRGAVLATQDKVDQSNKAEEMVSEGHDPTETRKALSRELGRWLPVSLLMDDSPAEHVFQYVVVNQKATAVPRALLGTIISTSLVADELQGIADRLEEARIPLQGSRIISMLSRDEDSPFSGLVAKGLDNEGPKLPWSVLGSLADIFQFLEGARYYHDSSIDHAKTWRTLHLADSPIVSEWQAREYASPLAFWKDLNGPWMDVFKAFWKQTRDRLGDTTNEDAHNAWGNVRTSNLFNKPSLHILAADFFAFLKEQRTKIASVEEIPELVNAWLEYVKPNYFARPWNLTGVKKDSVGTRRQWSKLWVQHRQNGSMLPPASEFSKLYKS
jgi:hypothetical protein